MPSPDLTVRDTERKPALCILHPAFCIAFCLLSLAATGADAAFTIQPYLQNLTDSSIVVCWENANSQPGTVQFGLTSGYGRQVTDSGAATRHELMLPALVRDTVYHYRAISGPDTSADFTFHTPVLPFQRFRFVAFGDDRSDSAAHQSVLDQMAQVDPAPGLLFNVGDLTASGTVANYQTFFRIEHEMVSRVPFFPVLGNHDKGNMTNWFHYIAPPGNLRWCTVRYGNSAFHCLDNYSTYTPGTDQYNWLLGELLADSANPAIRHIFMIFHEPPYTTNTGHPNNMTIRQYLCPLFERFHVAIAFQGHVHCYEHGLVNGVHYIITAGGGAPLYTNWNPIQPWDVFRLATLEFSLVDVAGDTIYCKSIEPDGTVIDSFAILPSPTAAGEAPPGPARHTLALSASPNPFSGKVRIRFSLPRRGWALLTIYDATGHQYADLANGEMPAGEHEVTWLPTGAPSGSYFCTLTTPDVSRTITLPLAR